MAAILNFDIFEKILEMAKFCSETSVTPLNICFLGQGIHFWGCLSDLTKITRNRGQKYPFLRSKWSKSKKIQNPIKILYVNATLKLIT